MTTPTSVRTQPGPTQLAFDLGHAESFSRENFLESPSNADAVALIEAWPDWPHPVLALVGPESAGKSHLAAIWAERAGARSVAARALADTSLSTALATGALVLEDVDEHQVDERALFHLLNMVREEGAFLLMTARRPPASWTLSIPDLMSRLRAVPCAVLKAPDDMLLRAVLVKLFSDRQLQVDESLVSYLLPRLDRSFAALHAAVARLDAEALRAKRPVNRALASEIFRTP